MTSPIIDHTSVGKSRVTLQYQNSPKFLAFIEAILKPTQELETTLQKIAELFDIDIQEGVNLDIIGEIVGISRVVENAIAVQFFGFEAQPGAQTFGEEGNPGIGGRFREELESETATTVLSDIEYRLLLKAKIAKNHAKGTNEDILNGLSYLFGANGQNVPAIVEDDESNPMTVRIAIGRNLTFLEKALIENLDILPRATGVKIGIKTLFAGDRYFGFDGQVGASSFGEEGDLTIGGLLSEEF